MTNRYDKIIDIINEHKPQTLVEVGTWNGERALKMIKAALNHHETVHYTGYDLFSVDDIEVHKREFNWLEGSKKVNGLVKPPSTVERINEKFLQASGTMKFTFELIMGDTRETLTDRSDDFVFLDGGHSVETIRSDYSHLVGCKVVVLDDYYMNYPDTDVFGCNQVVDNLKDVEVIIHPHGDEFAHLKGGAIHIVEVIH